MKNIGYIGLGKQTLTTNGGSNILPSVRLSNTDIRPLKFIHEKLTSLGIKCWLSSREGKRRTLRCKNGNFVKTIHDIGLSGKIQVKKFIQFVRPYVFVKGDQLDVVTEFISLREKVMVGRGNRQGIGKAEYTKYEISLIETIFDR